MLNIIKILSFFLLLWLFFGKVLQWPAASSYLGLEIAFYRPECLLLFKQHSMADLSGKYLLFCRMVPC